MEYNEQSATAMNKMKDVLEMGLDASMGIVQTAIDSILCTSDATNKTKFTVEQVIEILKLIKESISELKS